MVAERRSGLDPLLVPLEEEFDVPSWIFYDMSEHSLICTKCNVTEKVASGLRGIETGVEYFNTRVKEFSEGHKHE